MPEKVKSGGARMMAKGYRPISLWLQPGDMYKIKKAAEVCKQHATAFVVSAALAAANEVLKDSEEIAE